jgi:CRISPR-associated exonuclease Cas4
MEEQHSTRLMLPLAQLNAYAYCPRRFYYEFVLGEMVVNEHVLEGRQLHERVDLPGSTTRDGVTRFRRLYLCAPRLGLLGYCDLVETLGDSPDPDTIGMIAQAQHLYPVEYKKGKMGTWLSDHTQLCAQALALEEVLQVPIGRIQQGYIFYSGSARREQVIR